MRSIALITGGSRGLGKSMALHLANRGVDIIFTYRKEREQAEQVVRQLQAKNVKAFALSLDYSDANHFQEFATKVEQLLATHWQNSQLDFFVNNAGHGLQKPFMDITEAEFDELLNVHFKGAFFLTQQLVPLLKQGGSILNISTGLTRFTLPGMSAYAAMKGAAEVLTRYLAKELAQKQLRVNTLAPSAIATDFGGGSVRDNSHVNQMITSVTALGRVGEADDIGAAATAILMEGCNWINGQRIEASGGMFL